MEEFPSAAAREIADTKKRAYPGDTTQGEIALIRAGEFDESGLYVQLLEDTVEFPGGRTGTLPRVARSPRAPDGVVIIPITASHEIVIVRQFRHAPRIWTWGLPRGATEPGDTPLATVHHELLQEIGYQAVDAPLSLGRVIPDSGTLHEIPYIVAVQVRPHPDGKPRPDANERIAGHARVTYAEFTELCATGAVNDGLTMAAVLRLQPHFKEGRFEIDRHYIHKYSAFEFTPDTPAPARQQPHRGAEE